MRTIRTYHQVSDPAAEDVVAQVEAQARRLSERLAAVGRLVVVASGKGGVGKSAVTANLAVALAAGGRRVGAADADLNGPTLARMLGVGGQRLRIGPSGVEPVVGVAGVRVMSMDLLLEAEDTPVRWREPSEGGFIWQSTLETGAVREFLADVAWGELDVLLVDAPPGTDKIARLLGLLPRVDVLLAVTIPSDAATAAVARSIRLAREAGIGTIALVANMGAYRCPDCGREEPLYVADAARRLARTAEVPVWAEIPFDPRLAAATDAGRPFALAEPGSLASASFRELAERVGAEAGDGDPSAGAERAR